MSEVLVQFDEPQAAADGRLFIAQVNGQRVSNGLWEAWIEFYPREGGEPTRTRRETEQLTRGDLRFWAAGLTRAYLTGALERALSPESMGAQRPLPLPTSDAWPSGQARLDADLLHSSGAPLEPFEIYRRSGEYRLRQELRELDTQQLRDVVLAYNIPEIEENDAARTFEDALADRIVAAAQQRVQFIATAAEDPSASRTRSPVQ